MCPVTRSQRDIKGAKAEQAFPFPTKIGLLHPLLVSNVKDQLLHRSLKCELLPQTWCKSLKEGRAKEKQFLRSKGLGLHRQS